MTIPHKCWALSNHGSCVHEAHSVHLINSNLSTLVYKAIVASIAIVLPFTFLPTISSL